MPLSVTATRPELVALGGKTGLAAVIAAPAFHKSAEALIAGFAADWRPLVFELSAVALIARTGEEPFGTRATFALR